MSPWLILLIIVVIIFIVWWALMRNAKMYKPEFEVHGQEPEEEQPAHQETTIAAPVEEMPATAEAERATAAVITAAIQPDDLTRIEGIGPKVNQLLQAAGIQTFAQLAETSPESLKPILAAEGLQLIDPGTWPEQARLISEGKMEELEALTSRLKAGRHVG
jgi:large subunit ribosomal protein L17